jgi:hypothetical protein
MPQAAPGFVKKVLVRHMLCISQVKNQLDATLCRFYFCRVTLHVSGASAHHHKHKIKTCCVSYVYWNMHHCNS